MSEVGKRHLGSLYDCMYVCMTTKMFIPSYLCLVQRAF